MRVIKWAIGLSLLATLAVVGWAVIGKVQIDGAAQLEAGISVLNQARRTGNRAELLSAARYFCGAMRSYLPLLEPPRQAARLLAEVIPELERARAGDEVKTMVESTLADLDRVAFLLTPLADERSQLESRLQALGSHDLKPIIGDVTQEAEPSEPIAGDGAMAPVEPQPVEPQENP